MPLEIGLKILISRDWSKVIESMQLVCVDWSKDIHL